MDWIITIGGYSSGFFFEGTEFEAEEKRKFKANWEHAIGRRRLATDEEVKSGVIDFCKNHPNFNTKTKYHCECPKCELMKRRFKIERIKKRTK